MSVFDPDIPTTEHLRRDRTSAKWRDCPADLLPMFIAEMDFEVAPEIQRALIDRVGRSDLGYADSLTDLADAFAEFAEARWGWRPDPQYISGAPDVSFGVKAALRHMLPAGARVALTTPVYPSFFQYLVELGFECVEIPLAGEGRDTHLDIDALERAFAAEGSERVHGMILSNPHNPHGIAHLSEHLEALARIAADHDTFIVSDEIHATLTHHGVTFTPFAPIAARAGATSVTVTSASKGWNIAGTKCALVYAPPEIAPDSLREYLAVSLGYSVSILGREASTVAFRDSVAWLDAAITHVSANATLLTELLAEHVPGAKYTPPRTSYLAWIDLREAGLEDDPARTLHTEARVFASDGALFGETGAGHIRLNLGCSEAVLREAIERIGRVVRDRATHPR